MEKVSYTVRELRNLVRESTNEFKPVLGPGVEKANKTNNDKSYKKTAKDTEYVDGGLKGEKRDFSKRGDYNKNLLDLNPVNDVSDEHKKNIQAQVNGFSSNLEKNNGSNKNGNFQGNEAFLKAAEDRRKEHLDNKKTRAKTGLQARELPDEKLNVKTNTLTENKVLPKRLTFKKRFINEANMLQRIPEEYKRDGQVIYMKDRFNNEYVVECVKSEKSGLIETNVVNYNNKTKLDEQLQRMYSLFDYNSDCGQMNGQERVDESRTFGELMDLARGK